MLFKPERVSCCNLSMFRVVGFERETGSSSSDIGLPRKFLFMTCVKLQSLPN